MAQNETNSNQMGGMLFVGCIIIGTAIGMLTDRTGVGSMLGVGVGFVAMFIVRAIYSKDR